MFIVRASEVITCMHLLNSCQHEKKCVTVLQGACLHLFSYVASRRPASAADWHAGLQNRQVSIHYERLRVRWNTDAFLFGGMSAALPSEFVGRKPFGSVGQGADFHHVRAFRGTAAHWSVCVCVCVCVCVEVENGWWNRRLSVLLEAV